MIRSKKHCRQSSIKQLKIINQPMIGGRFHQSSHNQQVGRNSSPALVEVVQFVTGLQDNDNKCLTLSNFPAAHKTARLSPNLQPTDTTQPKPGELPNATLARETNLSVSVEPNKSVQFKELHKTDQHATNKNSGANRWFLANQAAAIHSIGLVGETNNNNKNSHKHDLTNSNDNNYNKAHLQRRSGSTQPNYLDIPISELPAEFRGSDKTKEAPASSPTQSKLAKLCQQTSSVLASVLPAPFGGHKRSILCQFFGQVQVPNGPSSNGAGQIKLAPAAPRPGPMNLPPPPPLPAIEIPGSPLTLNVDVPSIAVIEQPQQVPVTVLTSGQHPIQLVLDHQRRLAQQQQQQQQHQQKARLQASFNKMMDAGESASSAQMELASPHQKQQQQQQRQLQTHMHHNHNHQQQQQVVGFPATTVAALRKKEPAAWDGKQQQVVRFSAPLLTTSGADRSSTPAFSAHTSAWRIFNSSSLDIGLTTPAMAPAQSPRDEPNSSSSSSSSSSSLTIGSGNESGEAIGSRYASLALELSPPQPLSRPQSQNAARRPPSPPAHSTTPYELSLSVGGADSSRRQQQQTAANELSSSASESVSVVRPAAAASQPPMMVSSGVAATATTTTTAAINATTTTSGSSHFQKAKTIVVGANEQTNSPDKTKQLDNTRMGPNELGHYEQLNNKTTSPDLSDKSNKSINESSRVRTIEVLAQQGQANLPLPLSLPLLPSTGEKQQQNGSGDSHQRMENQKNNQSMTTLTTPPTTTTAASTSHSNSLDQPQSQPNDNQKSVEKREQLVIASINNLTRIAFGNQLRDTVKVINRLIDQQADLFSASESGGKLDGSAKQIISIKSPVASALASSSSPTDPLLTSESRQIVGVAGNAAAVVSLPSDLADARDRVVDDLAKDNKSTSKQKSHKHQTSHNQLGGSSAQKAKSKQQQQQQQQRQHSTSTTLSNKISTRNKESNSSSVRTAKNQSASATGVSSLTSQQSGINRNAGRKQQSDTLSVSPASKREKQDADDDDDEHANSSKQKTPKTVGRRRHSTASAVKQKSMATVAAAVAPQKLELKRLSTLQPLLSSSAANSRANLARTSRTTYSSRAPTTAGGVTSIRPKPKETFEPNSDIADLDRRREVSSYTSPWIPARDPPTRRQLHPTTTTKATTRASNLSRESSAPGRFSWLLPDKSAYYLTSEPAGSSNSIGDDRHRDSSINTLSMASSDLRPSIVRAPSNERHQNLSDKSTLAMQTKSDNQIWRQANEVQTSGSLLSATLSDRLIGISARKSNDYNNDNNDDDDDAMLAAKQRTTTTTKVDSLTTLKMSLLHSTSAPVANGAQSRWIPTTMFAERPMTTKTPSSSSSLSTSEQKATTTPTPTSNALSVVEGASTVSMSTPTSTPESKQTTLTVTTAASETSESPADRPADSRHEQQQQSTLADLIDKQASDSIIKYTTHHLMSEKALLETTRRQHSSTAAYTSQTALPQMAQTGDFFNAETIASWPEKYQTMLDQQQQHRTTASDFGKTALKASELTSTRRNGESYDESTTTHGTTPALARHRYTAAQAGAQADTKSYVQATNLKVVNATDSANESRVTILPANHKLISDLDEPKESTLGQANANLTTVAMNNRGTDKISEDYKLKDESEDNMANYNSDANHNGSARSGNNVVYNVDANMATTQNDSEVLTEDFNVTNNEQNKHPMVPIVTELSFVSNMTRPNLVDSINLHTLNATKGLEAISDGDRRKRLSDKSLKPPYQQDDLKDLSLLASSSLVDSRLNQDGQTLSDLSELLPTMKFNNGSEIATQKPKLNFAALKLMAQDLMANSRRDQLGVNASKSANGMHSEQQTPLLYQSLLSGNRLSLPRASLNQSAMGLNIEQPRIFEDYRGNPLQPFEKTRSILNNWLMDQRKSSALLAALRYQVPGPLIRPWDISAGLLEWNSKLNGAGNDSNVSNNDRRDAITGLERDFRPTRGRNFLQNLNNLLNSQIMSTQRFVGREELGAKLRRSSLGASDVERLDDQAQDKLSFINEAKHINSSLDGHEQSQDEQIRLSEGNQAQNLDTGYRASGDTRAKIDDRYLTRTRSRNIGNNTVTSARIEPRIKSDSDEEKISRIEPKSVGNLNLNEFSCEHRGPGFYQDKSSACRSFHHCTASGHKLTFECPTNTRFDANSLKCAPWFEAPCDPERTILMA